MGVELANIDFCVDPQHAIELLPDTCLDGNIKPLSFVEDTTAQITFEASKLSALFEKRGGFILSSGCEIPLEANPLNIMAMVQAAG
jgi:uroporphyrinogen decarboxylase